MEAEATAAAAQAVCKKTDQAHRFSLQQHRVLGILPNFCITTSIFPALRAGFMKYLLGFFRKTAVFSHTGGRPG